MKKKLLIVGGSGLIGNHVLEKFLNNNYEIINLDIKKQKIQSAEISYIKFNISDSSKFKKILSKIKKLDAYVNTSYPTFKTWRKCDINQITEKYFFENLNIHLKSYIWFTKLIADKMKKNKSGSIVLMNSIYGILGQDINLYKKTNIKENIVYPAIKGSITNCVKQFASIYSPFGIRINSVLSGGVDGHNHATGSKQLPKLFKKNYSSKVLLRRMADPQEIASSIYFLASKESSYITGTNLLVDGGYSSI